MKKRVYLDAAAAHPVRPSAARAFMRALGAYGNPSASHQEGQDAKIILDDARTRIARAVGAKADAVIFTSGATESNALAILGALEARIQAGEKPENLEVLYSEAQHASVIGAVRALKARGVIAVAIPVSGGTIDMDTLSKILTDKTALVTLDAVCGETGTVFDTRAVRRALDAHAARAGSRIVLHVDATQVPLVDSLDRTRLGADLISFDAQKIGGVRGIGVLIAPTGIPVQAPIPGGGQERGLRSGTPSPALAQAFAKALEDSAASRERFSQLARSLTDSIAEDVLAHAPRAVINAGVKRAPHILNISFMNRDTDYLVALLDEAGYSVATKSACETDQEGSRAIMAYTGDAARAASTLRISLHAGIRDREVRAFVKSLLNAVRFLDTVG